MKKTTHYYYILFASILHGSFTYSMKISSTGDMLEVTNSHTVTTSIYPNPQKWNSFARQSLRSDLEETINKEKLSGKVTIKASGNNVALALDYASKNPSKVEKLVLTNPKIDIAGINPLEYYWGNFPLRAIDKSKLKDLLITIKQDGEPCDINAKILIQFCQGSNLNYPYHLSQWYERMLFDIRSYGINKKDPYPELNAIFSAEKDSWMKNKISIIVALGLLFYLLSKKL